MAAIEGPKPSPVEPLVFKRTLSDQGLRRCGLCNQLVKAEIAAHECSHGKSCKYLTTEDNRVVNWKTPHCDLCSAAHRLADHDRISLGEALERHV